MKRLQKNPLQCECCGMIYQRSKQEEEFAEYATKAKKIDYGKLWYDELRCCFEERKMTITEVKRHMGGGIDTIRKKALEVGIDPYMNSLGRVQKRHRFFETL